MEDICTVYAIVIYAYAVGLFCFEIDYCLCLGPA